VTERHLHRSIASPLITAAIELRPDCLFFVSTHDIQLAIDQNSAQVLLVREFEKLSKQWDFQILGDTATIDDHILTGILGSRRKVLFVEGADSSLDRQLYELLLKNTSVRSVRTCRDVEHSTKSMRAIHDVHRVEAFGLVDSDQRTAESIQELQKAFVFALPCHSVESFYYCVEAIGAVHALVGELGHSVSLSAEEIAEDAVKSISSFKDALVRKRSTALVRKLYQSSFPSELDFERDFEVKIPVDMVSIYNEESAVFDRLVQRRDLNGLAGRYSLRDGAVRGRVAQHLQYKNPQQYEGAVRYIVKRESPLRECFLDRLGPLVRALKA
jgi:hypothetical protein